MDNVNEMTYEGNVGIQELVLFHRTATTDEKKMMDEYLTSGQTSKAWELLQTVTKTKLQD